jgi:hypothetical protein
MAPEFRACYGFSMWAPRGHWGPGGRAIHITQTRVPMFAYTLCGAKVSRVIDIFLPGNVPGMQTALGAGHRGGDKEIEVREAVNDAS